MPPAHPHRQYRDKTVIRRSVPGVNPSDARHLAHTGMLFIPSDSLKISPKPDRHKIHREMADALKVHPSHVKVPTVVIAPSNMFDQVWNAVVRNQWSDKLKNEFVALHSEGEIEFVRKN